MSEDKPPEAQSTIMTDEAIDSIVTLVESAEVFAKTFNTSVSAAMRMMLKSGQIMQRVQAGKGADVLHRMLTKGRPQ